MDRVKQWIKRICVLPPLPTVLLSLPAFGLVAYALAAGAAGPVACLAYALSAYALVISVTGCWRIAAALKRTVQAHPLGGRLVGDPKFRAEISLHQGFLINLAYIGGKLACGIRYRSPWFISLAVYYALLALMRLLLLFRRKRLDCLGELRRCRLCGMVLLLMNLALAGIVYFMVHQNRGYDYPGTLIYAMAAYSFYAVILAAVNVVKFRRHGSPVLSAAKAINLAAAMVSLLSLETAMLSRFGGEDGPLFRKRMTGAAGAAVCVLVLGLAVYMIAGAARSIRQLTQHH